MYFLLHRISICAYVGLKFFWKPKMDHKEQKVEKHGFKSNMTD